MLSSRVACELRLYDVIYMITRLLLMLVYILSGGKAKEKYENKKNVRSSFIINGKLKDYKFIIKVNIVESSMSLPLHSSLVGLFYVVLCLR